MQIGFSLPTLIGCISTNALAILCYHLGPLKRVSHIMKHCNFRLLAIVPQGLITGLGGSVPVFDEVISFSLKTRIHDAVTLVFVPNMSQINKIISFDKVRGLLLCEAGCILENLESILENKGFVMPLGLGAQGSC